MSTDDNLNFIPEPIRSVGFRAAGAGLQLSMGIIQRTTALRAYTAFSSGRDWMEKLSHAYVVALATRSADTLLMKHLQNHLAERMELTCRSCVDASASTTIIRERLFPELKTLRETMNDVLHYLDHPGNNGVENLNVKAVFQYCHQLFEIHADAFFGELHRPDVQFTKTLCKRCRAA